MSDLGASDYVFIALFAAGSGFLRYRWVQERAEKTKLLRLVGEVVTVLLLAAPVLMVIGALTGRLERNGS